MFAVLEKALKTLLVRSLLTRKRELNGVWRIEDEYTICREYGNIGKEFCSRCYKSGDGTFPKFFPYGSFVGDVERVD